MVNTEYYIHKNIYVWCRDISWQVSNNNIFSGYCNLVYIVYVLRYNCDCLHAFIGSFKNWKFCMASENLFPKYLWAVSFRKFYLPKVSCYMVLQFSQTQLKAYTIVLSIFDDFQKVPISYYFLVLTGYSKIERVLHTLNLTRYT